MTKEQRLSFSDFCELRGYAFPTDDSIDCTEAMQAFMGYCFGAALPTPEVPGESEEEMK